MSPAMCRSAVGAMVGRLTWWVLYAGLVMVHVLQLGPTLSLRRSPWFLVLLTCTMMERLSAFASDIAIERDWVTQVRECMLRAHRIDVVSDCLTRIAWENAHVECPLTVRCVGVQLSGKTNREALSTSNAILRWHKCSPVIFIELGVDCLPGKGGKYYSGLHLLANWSRTPTKLGTHMSKADGSSVCAHEWALGGWTCCRRWPERCTSAGASRSWALPERWARS